MNGKKAPRKGNRGITSKTVIACLSAFVLSWCLFSSRNLKSYNRRPTELRSPPPPPPPPPPQRCDYTFDAQQYSSFYDDKCWKKYSVDDWRHREGGASRALFDHGAAYLKSVLEYEEAKALREYLVGELSPKTLDGDEFFVPGFRNATGRFDLYLDPRSQVPVMDMLNKVVDRLTPTLSKVLGSNATLQELTVYSTCDSSTQHQHRDGCSLCCPISNVFKNRTAELARIIENVAVLKPSYYQNVQCTQLYSIFIALQPTTRATNGVTFLYPGTHLKYDWESEELDDNVYTNGVEKCEAPLNTGDAFIYNANTRHGANANPTKSARMMLVISFSEKGKAGRPMTDPGSIHPDFVKHLQIPMAERLKDSECSIRSCSCKNVAVPCYYDSGKVFLNQFPMTSSEFAASVA